MWYIRSPELSFIKHNWNFVTLINISPFLTPLSPHKHHYTPYAPLSILYSHVSKIIQYLSFCVWFISLGIMSSRFIQYCCRWHDFILYGLSIIQYNYTIFPLYENEIHFCIHSSVNEHLGCFTFWLCDNAIMNMKSAGTFPRYWFHLFGYIPVLISWIIW